MRLLTAFILLLATFHLSAQTTKIDPARLLKPGSNNTMLITNGSGAVTWGNAATLLTAGTGISISGNTITNSAPDQTVSLTEGTGLTITGTYPNFTLTPADASATNELQSLTAGDGTGNDKTINLSGAGGGSVTLAEGAGMTLTRIGNTITIEANSSASAVDVKRFESVIGTATTTVTVSGFTPDANDTMIYVDGVYMDIGTGEDVTISGSTLTFSSQLLAGQKVVVRKITLI